jgi:hypothetical protein
MSNGKGSSCIGYWMNPFPAITGADVFRQTLQTYEMRFNNISIPELSLRAEVLPDQSSYLYGKQPVEDWMLRNQGFTTYARNVLSLFTDWKFARDDGPVCKDHPVVHYNLFGEVREGRSLNNLLYRPCDENGMYGSIDPCITSFTLDTVAGVVIVNPGPNLTTLSLVGSIDSAVLTLQQDVEAGLYDYPYGTFPSYYRNFDFLRNNYGNVFRIGYALQYYNYGYWRLHLQVHEFSFDFYPQFIADNANTSISDLCIVRIKTYYDWHEYSYSLPGPLYSKPLGDISDYISNPTTMRLYNEYVPSQCVFFNDIPHEDKFMEFVGWNPDINDYIHTESATDFQSFCDVARGMLRDTLPLCYFSSIDSINDHFSVMESNHIEFLSEINDVLRPLDLAKLVSRALHSHHHTGIKLLLVILNILCDAELLYSFGIAPTLADAKDVARKGPVLVEKYKASNFYKPCTIYGDKIFDVPEDLSGAFPNLKVLCRSKIRLAENSDSFLPYIMPFKSLGLLPTISNLWDLIPFSFVIDWFTNAGDAAKALENNLLLLAFDTVYCTNSISIIYTFTEDNQIDYGFETTNINSAPLVGAGYKLYYRFLTKSPVQLGPTRFPIFGDSGVPNWNVAGSLLFKLLA